MTRVLLDKELHDLDAQLMRLGSLVDTALAQALEALETSDQLPEASILQGILGLGREVRSLLQWTMKAFADRNAEAARSLWEQDTVVNKDSYTVRRDVMAMLAGAHPIPPLQSDPHLMQRATYLLWIAYQLERAADHCSNLCERIVFIVQGETDMLTPLEG